MKHVSIATPVLLAVVLAAGVARAEPKEECIAANVKAQSLRREGRLRAAREQLAICGAPACPAMVRDDCIQRMDELERTIPSLVFDVKDSSGHDITNVRVTMDGQLLTDKLTGVAIPMDIGDHTFVFEAEGHPAFTTRLLTSEGQRARHETITLPDPPQPAPPPTVAVTPPVTPPPPVVAPPPPAVVQEPPPEATSATRTAGIALLAGGAGLVGISVITGILAITTHDTVNAHCDPVAKTCDKAGLSAVDQGRTLAIATDVAGGVGIAGVVVGAILFFVGAPSAPKAVEVRSGCAGHASVCLGGTF